jgi:hypothetical protein
MQTPPRPPPAPLVPPPAPRRPRAAPANAGVVGPVGGGRGRVVMPPLIFGNGSPPGGEPARSRSRKQKQRKQRKQKQTRKQKQQKD